MADGIDNLTAPAQDTTVTGIFDANGNALPAVRPGMNIIRYSDGTTRKIVGR